MLKELDLDVNNNLESECKHALDRLNKTVEIRSNDGYFKIKVDGEQFVIIRYNELKEVKYVLCFCKNISECTRYLNIAYRVIESEVI